jgi:hypothetical protein
MDAGILDDVMFLVLTFFLAITVTVAILVWGRNTSAHRV